MKAHCVTLFSFGGSVTFTIQLLRNVTAPLLSLGSLRKSSAAFMQQTCYLPTFATLFLLALAERFKCAAGNRLDLLLIWQ